MERSHPKSTTVDSTPCPVIKAPVKNTDQVHQILKDNPNIKPAELQSACILSTIRQQCDWRDVEKQAEATLDKQWIFNEKKKLKDIELGTTLRLFNYRHDIILKSNVKKLI